MEGLADWRTKAITTSPPVQSADTPGSCASDWYAGGSVVGSIISACMMTRGVTTWLKKCTWCIKLPIGRHAYLSRNGLLGSPNTIFSLPTWYRCFSLEYHPMTISMQCQHATDDTHIIQSTGKVSLGPTLHRLSFIYFKTWCKNRCFDFRLVNRNFLVTNKNRTFSSSVQICFENAF